MCNALDLPEQGNEPGCLFITFSATQVTPMATSTQIEKATWPLGPLPSIHPVNRPWPFVERSKPTISLDKQDKPGVTCVHGRGNEEDVSIYGTALMASEPPDVKQKPQDGDNKITVLVDSGASCNYFDEQRIPQFKYRLIDRVDPTVLRKILTAGGCLLDATMEGLLLGFGTDEYDNPHLVRIMKSSYTTLYKQ